ARPEPLDRHAARRVAVHRPGRGSARSAHRHDLERRPRGHPAHAADALACARDRALRRGGWLMVGLLAYLGMTALGTWMNARGQVKAGNAHSDLAYFNAKIAGLRAQDAIERGAEEEARFRMGIQQVIGTAIAGFAGQNVDVGIG